jgi:hypothetical protein
MSGLGAVWLRALVGKVTESERRRRAWKRTWRRRLLTMRRAALWVATHALDEKPPTELHKSIQEARRFDESSFMKEILPQVGLLLTLRRAASWVATHELDETPPTELHKAIQDARRSSERYFMDKLLPWLGLQPPPSDG